MQHFGAEANCLDAGSDFRVLPADITSGPKTDTAPDRQRGGNKGNLLPESSLLALTVKTRRLHGCDFSDFNIRQTETQRGTSANISINSS